MAGCSQQYPYPPHHSQAAWSFVHYTLLLLVKFQANGLTQHSFCFMHFPSNCRVVFYFMDSHNLLIHLCVSRHLGCFELEGIMSIAAINTQVQSCYGHMLLFLLGKFQRSVIAG